jgi:DNA-directed RNA polymerase subunit omega
VLLSPVEPVASDARCINTVFTLNPEFVRKATDKVGNPNVLVNIVSRRVRQMNTGGGGASRPMIIDVGNLGAADIALLEIIEEKLGWETPDLPDQSPSPRPKKKSRKSA